MSKLSFRARALDPSKQMPIYLAEELPDLPEYSAINRAVPQMPSGMEKEEESFSCQTFEFKKEHKNFFKKGKNKRIKSKTEKKLNKQTIKYGYIQPIRGVRIWSNRGTWNSCK